MLEPEVLCFYRSLPARELTARDVLDFMHRSLAVSDYALLLLATLLVTLLGMLPTAAYRLLFDSVIPSGEASPIVPIGVLLFGIICSQALIKVSSSVVNARLMMKMQVQLEAATYARVMLLPPSFFRRFAAGDLAHRVSSVSLFVEMFAKSALSAGLACVFSLLYVVQILSFAPALALPALTVALLQLVAVLLALAQTIRYNRRQMQRKTEFSGVVPALLRGVAKLKVAGAESRAFSFWARRYAGMAQALYGRPALLLAAPALVPLIAAAGTIVFYGVAATTRISVADYMAFNYAFGMVSGAIAALATAIPQIARLSPLFEMFEPIMKTVPETLSGQRQRILIARAVCGKPRVLMLDEATSALDNVTQHHVSEALARLDCTRIVIAHRLSTIREADRIVMLDGGRIVEDGSYDELIALGGKFADLVERQQIDRE